MDLALVFPGCHRRGGVERLVYEAARHASRRHDVTVYASEFEEHGLECVRTRKIPTGSMPRPFRLIEFSRGVRRALQGSAHDHVISFGVADVPADVLWVNSVHAAWLERRQSVAGDRIRSNPLRRYLPRHQIILALERRYFRDSSARLALVVSEQVAADLERLYEFPSERSVVVHNGFDEQEFNPHAAARDRESMRAELGIPGNALVVLLVANELSRKGFPILIEAVAALADPRVYVLLAGRADPAPYAKRLRALGLDGRFRYAGSRTDMVGIHGASDLFVLPTRYEAFSLAVVEALASGLPVITTDVPGARDLIVDDVNGRIQRDPFSSEELAALLRGATVGDRYRAWATHAAESVRDHTWSKLLEHAFASLDSGATSPPVVVPGR